MNLADMHCHILPGVDDGAQDPEMARALIQQAADSQISLIVATPHYHPRRGYRASDEQIQEAFLTAQKIAREVDPNLRLFLGREVCWGSHAKKMIDEGHVPTMGDSRYVLMEFSAAERCGRIEEGLKYALNSGYVPIFAHAERYPNVVADPGFVRKLRDEGIIIQLNASSIMGKQGGKVKRFCRGLLRDGAVHIISTDAHHPNYRPMEMEKCAKFVSKKYGEAYASDLFMGNAVRVLRDEYIR